MKKIILILTVVIPFCVHSQEKLILSKDGISIGENQYHSNVDSVICLDSCHMINMVDFSRDYQNRGHSIQIKATDGGDKFTVKNLKVVTSDLQQGKQFTVGKDTLSVYIDSVYKYKIVPTPKFKTPKDKTILTIYNDSIRIEKGSSVLKTFKRDSTNIMDSILKVDWISLSGIFDTTRHRISIVQDEDTTLYDNNSIVTEDACSLELGKGSVKITIDETATFKIDKGSKADTSHPWILLLLLVVVVVVLSLFSKCAVLLLFSYLSA